jgi:hypothetical protein
MREMPLCSGCQRQRLYQRSTWAQTGDGPLHDPQFNPSLAAQSSTPRCRDICGAATEAAVLSSLVRHRGSNCDDASIHIAMIALGRNLNLQVVVEGIDP